MTNYLIFVQCTFFLSMFYSAKMDTARSMCIIFHHIVPNADFYNNVILLANTQIHQTMSVMEDINTRELPYIFIFI